MPTTRATRFEVLDDTGAAVDGAFLSRTDDGTWNIRIPNPWGDQQHRAWAFTKGTEADARTFAAQAVAEILGALGDIKTRREGVYALAEANGGRPVSGTAQEDSPASPRSATTCCVGPSARSPSSVSPSQG